MKKVLAVAVTLIMVLSVFSTGFRDVREDHWAYDYISNLTSKGIIQVEEPNFKGFDALTRADAAVWMTRLVMYLENSPMIAKTPELDKISNRVKALETDLKDYNDFKARITRHLLMLKYDTFAEIDGLEMQIKDLQAALTKSNSETVELQEKVNFMQVELTVHGEWIMDLNDKVNALQSKGVSQAEFDDFLLDFQDTNRAISRIMTENVQRNQAIARIARRAVGNETAVVDLKDRVQTAEGKIAILEEAARAAYFARSNVEMLLDDFLILLEDFDDFVADYNKNVATNGDYATKEEVTAMKTTLGNNSRELIIIRNNIDAIFEDLFDISDELYAVTAKTDEIETKIPTIELKLEEIEGNMPAPQNLLPVYLLALVGVGLGIYAAFIK